MSELNSSFSNKSSQEKHDEMILCIDQVNAMINVAMAARFSELDEATTFHYFHILSDIVATTKLLANTLFL